MKETFKKSVSYFHTCFLMNMVLLGLVSCSGSGSSLRSDTPPDFANVSVDKSAPQGRLTILLAQYNQPNSISMAQRLQKRARQLLKTNDIWLSNDDLGLAVNYGHFNSENQAQEKLDWIRTIYKDFQAGPWQFAYIKEIPEPDPPAPEEWNLINNYCDYTLEVDTYFDLPEQNYYDRKKDALRAVQKLRQDGVPAFFVHGQKESRVYIGCLQHSDVQNTIENGRAITRLSTTAQELQRKHPYHFQHSAQVFIVNYDDMKNKTRIPKPSVFISLDTLRGQLPF
ncbi:MAG: hypothetical protein JW860_05665 [Sedimentisphaerales bacterium]|nr:hypothetical protein [Sedimentisphaerales bacterium]